MLSRGKPNVSYYHFFLLLFLESVPFLGVGWINNVIVIAVDSKELRTIYKQFKKETPTGVIGKAELREFMKQMNISDPFVQDVVFRM